jgi:hypothetical protein
MLNVPVKASVLESLLITFAVNAARYMDATTITSSGILDERSESAKNSAEIISLTVGSSL